MLLNYLKLSLRLMARTPFFTFIKVSGLAVGLAMFFILWQYTQSELNSDQQWKDADQTYRIGTILRWTDNGSNWSESHFATCVPSLVDEIVLQYPEILEATSILSQQCFVGGNKENSCVTIHGTDLFVSVQNGAEKKSFKEEKLAYGDANLFTFFGVPLIEGRPESALKMAGSIALSEKLAVKYFGTTDVIGKAILINDKISLTVTAVFQALPRNTHLLFEAVISSEGIKKNYNSISGEVHTPVHYVKMKEGVDKELSKRINEEMHLQIKSAYGGNSDKGDAEIFLQPLRRMPFQSYIMDEYNAKSELVLIILQAIAVAILFLAWINYINLASAANLKRMKEVATRRTMGAKIFELTTQFVLESFTTNFFALCVALTLVQLVRTPMEMVFGFYLLSWESLLQSTLWILIATFLTGVIITGIYPAWFVMGRNFGGLYGRVPHLQGIYNRIFTTLQYTVAIIIAVLAFTIKEQLNFILKYDMGLNKEEVVLVDLPYEKREDFKIGLNTFLSKVRELRPARSRTAPGGGQGLIGLGQPGKYSGVAVIGDGGVDENFIPLYQIEMLAGRNFLSDNPADSSSILVSDITMMRIGFETPGETIGKKVIAKVNENVVEVTIVGVYRDYNTLPLLNNGYYQSAGTALTYKDFLFSDQPWSVPERVSFRISSDEFENTLSEIESAYRESFADPLFNWYFLNDQLNGRYKQYMLISNQVGLFCFLTVGLACLGLLGMMMHKVNNKLKEIGIRKVLGAQLHEIAHVLLNTSIKQIAIAAAIGVPVAYYLTQQYLQRFSQQMELHWWHLALPVGILVTIMLSTITSTVWKAARNNPVEALKCE